MPGPSFAARFFACLTCTTAGVSEPSSQPSGTQSRGLSPTQQAQAASEAAVGRQVGGSAPKKAAEHETSRRPEPSRTSSHAQLDLPLEYVNLDPAVEIEDGPVRDIMGRKASYSMMASNEPSLPPSDSSHQIASTNGPPTVSPPGGTITTAAGASVATPAAVQAAIIASSPPTVFEVAPPVADHSPSSSVSQVSVQTDAEFATSDEEQVVQPEGPLLGPQSEVLRGRKCLVLDLDETLVHSSFKYLPDADFLIPVEIENRVHNVFVVKRPGVDEFLQAVGELFEVVVFTASVAKYGDPLLDHLDIHNVVHHRLFRESCFNYNGNFIKNLSQLGRPLKDVIIIDNSPASYALQPQHAVPISSWFSDIHDDELLGMLPFLRDLAFERISDVSRILDEYID